MKKFFKFGSSKKKPGDVPGPSSPHRRSLVSLGSTISSSGSQDIGRGSFSSNADGIKGYQIDATKDKNFTKLHKACWAGDLETVKRQIKKIDINQVDSESRTPLHLASARAHKEVIWFLLGSKAKPNLPDSDGNTPLLKAVQYGHADIVQFLLERGADPKASDVNGNSGLHHVACNGHQDIAFSLIQKGADINAKNEDGTTPLTISTIHRQLDMTELLLRHGASVNISDKEKKTCLMFACVNGYDEFVKTFMQHGVDVNSKNNMGHTAEDMARLAGHDECVSTLSNARLHQNSAQKNQQEHQRDDGILLTKRSSDLNFTSESDEQSRASQVDLNADFNDSDLDSWNDNASEASMQNDHGVSVDLSKFLASNEDLSNSDSSDMNLDVNHYESPKILQDVKDLQKNTVENKNENAESQIREEAEGMAAKVVFVPDNDSDSFLQKPDAPLENDSNSELRNDRAFLAELGLSDVSEVSTPTFSEFSVKDGAHKEADTDVEDDEIKDDIPNKLVVGVVKKEVAKDTSLPKASTKKNVDAQSIDSVFSENVNLKSNEPNTALTHASQNMGSLQTVYVSFKKDGSINDGSDSDTDWDDESGDNNMDGPIHIHPIILRKRPLDEYHSNQVLQNSKHTQILHEDHDDDPFHGKSSTAPVIAHSMELVTTGQTFEETNHAPYTLLLEVSKKVPSNEISSEGTLGRPGTMHEVEEMWVNNPIVEIAKEAAQSAAKSTQSPVKKKLAEGVDNIYRAELALVNSRDTSRENTLDGHQKTNYDQSPHGSDEIKNSEALSREQLWDRIWLQICGKLKIENDTESSDEISSVAVTDQENKDSSFSSADIDQSSPSAQDEVPPYQLLHSFIKDPNCSCRVIDLIQYLRLAWQKEQDKSKVWVEKIKLLKREAQKATDKTLSLNASKVDTESEIHRLEAELESAKHALKNQENMFANVELELERSKTQLLIMEEKLLHEITAKQQTELAVKAYREEAEMRQDFIIEWDSKLPSKVISLADFCCQTDEILLGDNMFLLGDERENLQSEVLSLRQKVDSLTLLISQQSNLKDQIETSQNVLNVNEKDLTQLKQKLTEMEREYSVKLNNEKMLNIGLEKLQEDYLIASKNLITYEEKNGKLSKDLALANNNLEECNLKISLLEMEIQTMKAKEERNQSLLKAQMNENEQQKQETTDLQKRLTQLQSDNTKMKFEMDNGANIQQLVLDQEKTQQQIMKTKEEKYVVTATENEKLKLQIEEIKEQQLLSVQKVNVLTEKLLNASSMKTEVTDLQSQLAIASNKASLAESKIGELKKQLLEERTAGLRFLTVEKESEETSKKLNLANDTIAAIEKLLAEAQENEKKNENQFQNQRQDSALKLQDADNKIKEIYIELDVKEKMIQDLTERLKSCTKLADRQKPTSNVLVQDPNENRYDVETDKVDLNHSAETQENEDQFQNQCQASALKLQDADDKIKKIYVELDVKDKMIQDLTERLKSCAKLADRQRPTSSGLVQDPNENRYNVETDNVDSNHSVQGPMINSANKLLEDVTVEANQEWHDIRGGIMTSSKYYKYEEALKQLQEQVDILKKQSMEGKDATRKDPSMPSSSNGSGQQSIHVLPAESLTYQINLLGKQLQAERQQKEEYQAEINAHKQQLSKANDLLKRAMQMHHVQTRFDDSANILKNSVDDVDMEFTKYNWEIEARRDLNQQLNKINKFLEDRSLANDHLEQLHKEREVKLHRDYQRAVRDLRFEVQQLHEELQDKESNRKIIEEQNQHRRKLNAARKRVKAKLRDHTNEKSNTLGKHLQSRSKDLLLSSSTSEYAMSSMNSLRGMSGSGPESPVINNLKSFKDLESAISARLSFARDPVIAQQLSGAASFDSQFKSNINTSLDKTTSEYLEALKKNYLL